MALRMGWNADADLAYLRHLVWFCWFSCPSVGEVGVDLGTASFSTQTSSPPGLTQRCVDNTFREGQGL